MIHELKHWAIRLTKKKEDRRYFYLKRDSKIDNIDKINKIDNINKIEKIDKRLFGLNSTWKTI